MQSNKKIHIIIVTIFIIVCSYYMYIFVKSHFGDACAIYLSKKPKYAVVFPGDDPSLSTLGILLKENNPILENIELEDKPLIKESDIIKYDFEAGTIYLKNNVLKRDELPNLYRRIFVVCLGKKRMYWGAFWSRLSSLSTRSIVIIDPGDKGFTISKGYPWSSNNIKETMIYSEEIRKRFKKIGKLR